MKRNGSAGDIVWFRAESCYVFHVMNAWEEDSRIVADVMQFEEAPLFPHPDGSPTDPEKSRARLCRWSFDLSGNTDRFTQTYLDDLTGEFPRIDERRAGLGAATAGTPAPIRTCRCSARCRASCMSMAGDRGSAAICCPPATPFRSRYSSNGRDAAEGDGWLLAAVWRASENRSDLAVFNAGEVGAGPVALVSSGTGCPTVFMAIGWGLCERGCLSHWPPRRHSGARPTGPREARPMTGSLEPGIRDYPLAFPGSSLRDAPE